MSSSSQDAVLREGPQPRAPMGQWLAGKGPLPTVALSVRQPWAWLIVHGLKDIENRSWPTRLRGPVLIHAARAWGPDERDDCALVDRNVCPVDGSALPSTHPPKLYQLGGIVGVADVVDCVAGSTSRWFVGRYGFVLANARPLPFMPLRGQLGFFPAEYVSPDDGEAAGPSPLTPRADTPSEPEPDHA